jgi:CheY-like chemotaxis protein
MDVQMPVMDGLAASRAIRELDSPSRDVPIVALTASVLSDDRARYAEAGMDDCLPKPFDATALNAVLVRSSRKAARDVPTARSA